MDWLTFIVETIKVLAWSITVILALIIFRPPLKQLLESFAVNSSLKLKWGDKEFDLKVREVAKRTRDTIPPPPLGTMRMITGGSQDQVSPKLLIADAWNEVQNTTSSALGITTPASTADILSKLKSMTMLNLDEFKLFTDLQALRNEVTHIPEYAISTSTAQNYAEAAHKLAQYINTQKNR